MTQKRQAWEEHRHEIERLWVTESRDLSAVISLMQTLHGFQASVSSYKRQLSRWGMKKNMTRPVAFRLLQSGNDSTSLCDATAQISTAPANQSARLEKYLRRNHIRADHQRSVIRRGRVDVCKPDQVVTLPQPWNIHARFLHSVSMYIQRSCESQLWHYPDHELLVESSLNQFAEKTALHNFVTGIDTGRALLRHAQPVSAFHHWGFAARQIDVLVHGSYHDILPNLLLKLCELFDEGEIQLVQALMMHIARFSQYSKPHQSPESGIYKYFESIDATDLPDLYERVMQEFVARFKLQFPSHAYNNHVMQNNLVRRRLKSLSWTKIDHELPDLNDVEEEHGLHNRRSMDIIALRADCALERGSLLEAERTAGSLIDRAHRIDDDRWLELYYLFQGYYIRGCAMHEAQFSGAAEQNLKACLHVLDTFRELLFGFMFETQKLDALQRLTQILTQADRHEEAAKWHAQWRDMLLSMQNLDAAAQVS